jgi:hypothetical protein
VLGGMIREVGGIVGVACGESVGEVYAVFFWGGLEVVGWVGV